jgi:hypothetical protein
MEQSAQLALDGRQLHMRIQWTTRYPPRCASFGCYVRYCATSYRKSDSLDAPSHMFAIGRRMILDERLQLKR